MNTSDYHSEKEYRMSFQEEALTILSALSLSQKVSLLSGKMSQDDVVAAIHGQRTTHYNEHPYLAGGLDAYGLPPLQFVDGTRGVVCDRGKYTCFPVAAMRGAAFNPVLEEKVGKALAEEVLSAGGNFFGGVCVNLPYHPGWGRAQEVYGEDPYMIGELASALIRGIQSKGVIACVKHYAFNSMENMRFEVDITCDLQTEREVFLAQFKKCIDAGAAAVMSAYNRYQGTFCGHSTYLLEDVLRQEWGFDGIVISDFNWGISDTKAAAAAGIDVEMPNTFYFGDKLITAVESGQISENIIDRAALHVVRTLLAYKKKSESLPAFRQSFNSHSRLALQCAREGITLLRNQDNILPLRGKRAGGTIAVLGRLAEMENTGDRGSSQVYAPYVVSVMEGLQKQVKNASIIYYSGDNPAHCRRLAAEADTVIIVAGNTYMEEGEHLSGNTRQDDSSLSVSIHENTGLSLSEATDLSIHIGGDRTDSLGLAERDLRIINAVADIRNDAVVVLYGGSTILMTEWYDKTGAILFAYYPGMEGGTAVAETIFGKNNPSGRLPFVIPYDQSDLPDINWASSHQEYGYYHGYTLLDVNGKKPLYPFGFGLSFTTFAIHNLHVWSENPQNDAEPDDTQAILCAEVTLTNNGNRTGSEVLFLYVGKKDTSVRRPVKLLKAFEKVSLKKNEQKIVTLKCRLQDLMYFDTVNHRFQFEKGTYQIYVTAGSIRDTMLSAEIKL